MLIIIRNCKKNQRMIERKPKLFIPLYELEIFEMAWN